MIFTSCFETLTKRGFSKGGRGNWTLTGILTNRGFSKEGRRNWTLTQKVYQANPHHPLFHDIRSLVLKHSGLTQIVEEVVERVGEIHKVWIRGDFAEGKDAGVMEMVVMGQNIDLDYFSAVVKKAEALVKRQIHYIIISPSKEAEYFSPGERTLLIWKNEPK